MRTITIFLYNFVIVINILFKGPLLDIDLILKRFWPTGTGQAGWYRIALSFLSLCSDVALHSVLVISRCSHTLYS